MRRWIRFLLLTGIGCTMPTVGYQYCPGSIELGAEALYFRRSTCNLKYALFDERPFDAQDPEAQLERLASGAQQSIEPDFEWGFRVMAGYRGCWDVRGQYTRVCGRDSSSVESGQNGVNGIWVTFGYPRGLTIPLYGGIAPEPAEQFQTARAVLKSRWHYDAADISVAGCLPRGCGSRLQFFVGLHYARIEQTNNALYEGVESPPAPFPPFLNEIATVEQSAWLWGLGPRFGIEGCYPLLCNFGLAMRLGVGGLVASELKGRFAETLFQTTATEVPIVDRDQDQEVFWSYRHHMIPEFDGRLGICYQWCCGCWQLHLEIGYEFIAYFDALNVPTFNDGGGTLNDNCYNFHLDGLYLRGEVTF